MDPLKIVIIGPPGSGKEVQGKELAKKYDLQYSGYRQCLVHHLTNKTELGEQFRPFYTQKKAVPGELMNKMLHEVVDSNGGFVIKGYPITEAQADTFIEEFGPDLCIFIRIPQEVSRERLNYRRIDPETREVYNIKSDPPPDQISPRMKRMKSDSPVNINKRLSSYYESSNFENAVVKKFNYVIEVDGNQSKEDVNTKIIDEIDKFLNHKKQSVEEEDDEEDEEDVDEGDGVVDDSDEADSDAEKEGGEEEECVFSTHSVWFVVGAVVAAVAVAGVVYTIKKRRN